MRILFPALPLVFQLALMSFVLFLNSRIVIRLSSINCYKIYECLVLYIYTNKRVLSLETRIVWRREIFPFNML